MTAKNMAALQEDKNIPKPSKEDFVQSKPSPTPLTIKGYDIVNKDGYIACVNQDKPEDAAFIVRAVNCYEELLERLKVCYEFLKSEIPNAQLTSSVERVIAKAEK